MSQQSYTGQCKDCPHPAHYGPCTGIYMYDRPGGYPGNQQCLCGHLAIQQTITVTPDPRDEQISALQAEVARLTALVSEMHPVLARVRQERDTLKRENEALRQDKERLDWLDEHATELWTEYGKIDLDSLVPGTTGLMPLRALIDAAREALDAASKERG